MRNENMGWECPKCSRCYAPTVQECSDCIPKQNDDTVHFGSPLAYNPNTVGHQVFIGGTGVSNHNSISNVSRACLNFVEVKKGNKNCYNCGKSKASHIVSTYTTNQ